MQSLYGKINHYKSFGFFLIQGTGRVKIIEGTTVQLAIIRAGEALTNASVKYRTVDGTAKANSLDFQGQGQQEVFFNAGENEHNITINTYQDGEPETDEFFYVEMFDPQGLLHTLTLQIFLCCSAKNN